MSGARSVDTSLGIVVLTHGRSAEAPRLSAALVRDGVPPTAIVVVQNPTDPGDPELEVPGGTEVIRMDRNAGYAMGMNAGIRRQLEKGVELVLILTHEVRFRPGALAALVAAMRSADDFGVLGPALWWSGEDRPFSYGGRRRPRGGIEHIQDRPSVSGEPAACDWIDGAAMLFRSELLEQIGLVEERFFIYVEDAEICLRAWRAGWRVGVVLDALAETSPGGGSRPGAWLYLSTRNSLEYARLNRGVRGVLWELARRAKGIVNLARAYAAGWRDPARRARCLLELKAVTRGTFDFFRRRWGPPPPQLTGMGDMAGTGAEGSVT
jgi:GT2 family glycosyltransferase